MEQPEVMVYLMTGFLDSGKSQFLKFTLAQDYFQIDGTTLLLLCEEGEEEYDAEELKKYGVVIETVDSQEELTEDLLAELDVKYRPERVVIEYNGMWKVSDFEKMKLPEGWGIEQKLTTVDASTFQMYLTNLKPLFVEMVRDAELVLFNRCTDLKPLAGYRRSVKVVNQGAQIIFEGAEGEIEDIFSDQMPYDLDAPVIKIEDMDYGIWYVDMMDNPEKYKGKVVEIQGRARKVKGFPKGEFVLGRSAMTCCADDITFLGFICKHMAIEDMKANTWVRARGKVGFEFKRAYRGRGPVITLESLEPIQEPEDELVYFN